MTKAALVQHLADAAGITRSQAGGVLDALGTCASDALRSEGNFTLPGMVRFSVATRQARQGRNVRTGEPISIPARQVVRAKVSKPFQSAVVGD